MQNKTYRNCVAIALYSADKLFLARKPREHHAWALPQGGVDAGETLEQAIIRETKEELDLDIKNPELTDIKFTYDFPADFCRFGEYCGQEVKFFLAPFPVNQTPHFGLSGEKGEPVEGAFFSLAEAEKLIEDPRYFVELKKLYAQISHA